MASQITHYRKTAKLGHTGTILCMRATEDGKLACGGSNGVKIWNVRMKAEVKSPCKAGLRGATTALTWLRHEDELEVGLVYGTQAGFLVGWREDKKTAAFEETYCVQMAQPSEITGLAYEAASNRLAVCNRNAVIQLFAVDGMVTLRNIVSVTICSGDCIPKAIAFGPISGEDRRVLVFGLHDGQVHTLRTSDGKVENTLKTGSMIGDAHVSARGGVFVIDDPLEGAALYRLNSGTRVRTYPVPTSKSIRARQVSFAEDSSHIIIGGDHGIVYAFDRRSGEVADKLELGSDIRVQVITAMDIDMVPTIIAAKLGMDGEESEVIIWQKIKKHPVQEQPATPPHSINHKTSIAEICMYLASVAFLWQNITAFAMVVDKVRQWIPSAV